VSLGASISEIVKPQSFSAMLKEDKEKWRAKQGGKVSPGL
jgi:hypothetical protein